MGPILAYEIQTLCQTDMRNSLPPPLYLHSLAASCRDTVILTSHAGWESMSRAVQRLATEMDQLHQGLPEAMVCSLQWHSLVLQVCGMHYIISIWYILSYTYPYCKGRLTFQGAFNCSSCILALFIAIHVWLWLFHRMEQNAWKTWNSYTSPHCSA